MKRKRSDGTRESGASPRSGGLSTSEARLMISKEVQASLEQSDLMLKALMDRIREVDGEPKYESRIKKLEMQVKKVKRRGDQVFAFIRKRGNPEPPLDRQDSLGPDPLTPIKPHRLSPEPEPRDHHGPGSAQKGRNGDGSSPSAAELDATDGGSARKPKEGFWQRLRSKQQIVDLTDDDGGRQDGARHDDPAQSASPVTAESSAEDKGDQAREVADGSASSDPVVSETKRKEKELILTLPLLPIFPFPDPLPAAALTTSPPQRPVVKLARIDSPPGIALLWNVEKAEPEPAAAPVAHYCIYTAQRRGDGTFSKWRVIGEIKAMPLPMACRVAARGGGKALVFAVIGRDVYGRHGAFSEICTTWDGEM